MRRKPKAPASPAPWRRRGRDKSGLANGPGAKQLNFQQNHEKQVTKSYSAEFIKYDSNKPMTHID
jgi:hypothetical protein